ncbi:MAG TPA: VCBS repeat-containing protein, partial [bacterium]|nr:VCBS repeat-containing protein [bacterium]
GPARFEDMDGNAAANSGDRVVVGFSEAVVVNGALADDFVLPVADDTFGVNASVAAGPAANEVTITLGQNARLRTRGRFDPAAVSSNEPSGIDVQNGQGIVAVASGVPASASAAVDIGPMPVAASAVAAAGQRFAIGDLNVDGLPDVVVSDSGTLTPFVNTAGVLAAAAGATGEAALTIGIGNLNRSGNPEVVTGDVVGVRIWDVSGLPGAIPSLQETGFVATGSVNDLVIVDVDQDAFQDIVVAGPVGISVAIHQRNLGNDYAIGQQLTFATPARRVLAVDIDGDGDRDVLALFTAVVRVLRNDGGTLSEQAQLPANGVDYLSAADTDGDGQVELLFSGQGTSTLFRRDAAGVFQPESLNVAAEQAELVDLDGDTFADLAARTADGLELLQNDRMGGFEPLARLADGPLADFAASDLDRDGDGDLVALGGGSLSTFLGSLAGTFGDTVLVATQDLGASATSKQELADVDGDGQEDRIVLTPSGAEVWLGDGDGGFAFAGAFASAQSLNPTALVLGDLDGDGDRDCVLGFDGDANEAFVNDGAGQFSFAWAFSPAACRSLAFTDYDGDGDLDVFVGNDGDNELYRNDTGNGTVQLFLQQDAFDNVLQVAVGNETIALVSWDFDRDGDDDLVVVNGGTITSPQDAYVLRNGANGYSLAFTLITQLLATGAALGDVDNDGRDDLAIAQLSSNGSATVKWFRGLNTTISTLPTNVATNGQYFSRSLVIADIDGDGRSDFVVGDVSVSNQPIAVLLQQPNGDFTVGQEFASTRLEALHAGDFDNDGDVDIVTVETTGPSRVLLNR